MNKFLRLTITVFLGVFLFYGLASAQNVMKIVVNGTAKDVLFVIPHGDKKLLRASPGSRGKVVEEIFDQHLLVESVPVQSKNDKSLWYRVLFVEYGANSHFYAAKTKPYINARDVREETEAFWINWCKEEIEDGFPGHQRD
ncbi:MAG: hypothetical protein LBQ42_13380 [Synergistaceae bacterium]|jgi:hypothetical protein|nr:hypothetical protein [Synergistaceae bacterium]